MLKKGWGYGLEFFSCFLGVPWAKPRGSDLIVTHRCNFQCHHCDIWQIREKDELTQGQWFKIIDDLRKWLGPNYLVSIGGGEPLLRDDIFVLLNYLVKNNFQVVLETNGYLVDRARAQALVQTGLAEVRVSLYSLTPALHDAARGIPGAAHRARGSLFLLKKAKEEFNSNLKISIGLLLYNNNIGEEAINLINWAIQNNFHLTMQALDENFKGNYQNPEWHKTNPLWPTDKLKIKSFFSWLLAVKRESGLIDNSAGTLLAFQNYFLNPEESIFFSCPIGYRTFNIDPLGHPFFCYKTGAIAESLVNRLASRLWSSPALQAKRDLIRNCRKICRIRCYYQSGLIDRAREFFLRAET